MYLRENGNEHILMPNMSIFDDQKLYVVFKKENDYFLLQEVVYAYMDIVTGMEGVDFECSKIGDRMKIKILKI